MSTLTIRTQNTCNTTTIENHFIDSFMPKANGEYVKIYLYLIRIMNDPNCGVTLAKIADSLEHTEKDILRALNYWEREGLLRMSWDQNRNITAIDIIPATSASGAKEQQPLVVHNEIKVNSLHNVEAPVESIAATTVLPELTELEQSIADKEQGIPVPNTTTASTSRTNDDFKQIIFITEAYLGRTLSKSEFDSMVFFYDDLHFSADLIEYLIEYCVENGHSSMHYINAVANSWHKEAVTTVEAAKAQIINNSKSYYIILRSFGITGRSPIQHEVQLMDKWMNEFGFSLEIINEACTKTIAAIHNPNFNYADTILTNWKKENVHYLNDILKLDEAHKSKGQSAPKATPKNAKATTNNFEQRNYDFDAIEQQLLNVQ